MNYFRNFDKKKNIIKDEKDEILNNNSYEKNIFLKTEENNLSKWFQNNFSL